MTRAYFNPSAGDWPDEYDMLVGPGGFECLLTEPEDRTWYRDGSDVVDKLNEQHVRIEVLLSWLEDAVEFLGQEARKAAISNRFDAAKRMRDMVARLKGIDKYETGPGADSAGPGGSGG